MFAVGESQAWAEPISQIVVFGDSLSDCGNVFAATGGATPAAPYYEGRFSNGPVWVERLAARLGVPTLSPSQSGGLDFAYGGAETGDGFSSKGTPNLLLQHTLYGLSHTPARGDLFVIWGGSNDLFTHVGTSPSPDVTPWVGGVAELIRTLSANGAQQFLVANLPPLGETPSLRAAGLQTQGNALATEFNTALASELVSLRTTLGVTIHEVDAHRLFTEAVADPAKFGLTNVSDWAYDAAAGAVVPNPGEYLFWDDAHPTATVHAALGDLAAAAVPEPTASVLLLSAACVIAVVWIFGRRACVKSLS
jgi:3-phytase